jgi:hypothetical protein
MEIANELLHFVDGLLMCDLIIFFRVEEFIAPNGHVTCTAREEI